MGFFSAVLGFIGSALSSIGSLAVSALRTVGGVFSAIGSALGLIGKDEKVEDIGEKALQADKKLEDFSTSKEYLDFLKTVKIDEKKIHDEKEQLEKGIEVMEKAIREKNPEFPMEEFANFEAKNPDYFTSEKMEALSKVVDFNTGEFSEIIGVMNGTERDDSKIDSVIEKLAEVEKAIDSTLSDNEAKLNVIEGRRQ